MGSLTNKYRIENHTAVIGLDEYLNGYRNKDKFIAFCKRCDKYGCCWVCPPYDFDTEEYLSGYAQAYILGTKIIPDEEARLEYDTPEKALSAGRQMLAEVRRFIDPQLLGTETRYPGSKAFFAGTCFQCPEGTCTRVQHMPCVHPDKVRPSLEAFGFDIGKTAGELLHIELKWSKDGTLPEYFTLVSGLFTNHPVDRLP